MPNQSDNNSDSILVTHKERISIIKEQILFTPLIKDEIENLASLAFEKKYSPNQIIVAQGEIIDAVYLIIQGEVEVAIEKKLKHGAVDLIPQAILRKGDSIGLSNTGFYSPTGIRAATLTATSDVIVIGWTITAFKDFLQSHPALGPSTEHQAELMLRMKLIKQADPFSNVSPAYIARLIENIQQIQIDSDTIIFHEGDKGDKCYLIREGKVQISTSNEDGSERILAVLEPPMLFGEIALLTDAPRNATAKMIEPGYLLVLEKNQLDEIINKHDDSAESMLMLIMERSRPSQLPGIEHYKRSTADGHVITILKNNNTKRYYQLSEIGWYIWQQLNGKLTIQDIAIELFNKEKIFAVDAVIDTVVNLASAGFISLPSSLKQNTHTSSSPSLAGKIKLASQRIIYHKHVVKNIDSKLSKSYNDGIRLLYTKFGEISLACFALIGFISFITYSKHAVDYLPSISHPLLMLILLLITYMPLIIFHELGHAYTAKAFGHEVNRAGIVFYWIGLIAYVDTSDMWLSEKKPQICVNIAGAYVDIILGGMASLCAWLFPQSVIAEFFWLLALLLYCSVHKTLNPIYESDGYYILADFLNYPKLRLAAFTWLKRLTLKSILNINQLKMHSAEATYWLVCVAFLVISILFSIIFQYYLRLILPTTILGVSMSNLIWILPVLILINFLLTVTVTLRKL